jgi:hypothetical protein
VRARGCAPPSSWSTSMFPPEAGARGARWGALGGTPSRRFHRSSERTSVPV